MGKKLLHSYKNGNYNVEIYEDGTKIRETEADEFIAEFPENIDIKISNKCDLGCEFCHEASTSEGKIAHFNWEFLWSLKPGTELAIGGGNIFENKKLRDFLGFCKDRGIIANITINQSHLYSYFKKTEYDTYCDTELKGLGKRGLLNGVGISYNGNSEQLIEFFKWANTVEDYSILTDEGKMYRNQDPILNTSNFVIHVINGVHSYESIMKLANKGFKLLILGYKDLRRGSDFLTENQTQIQKKQKEIYDNIHKLIDAFEVVSFDNLALEQLNVRRLFTTEEWEEFYMGDDGSHTMYIDLVEGEFAKNSTSLDRFSIEDNIIDMFNKIKKR